MLGVEVTQIWLTENLEFLGAIIILLCGVSIVFTAETVAPGIAGMAIAYSLNIVINMQFSVKSATQVESIMNAVERLLEYTELPREKLLISDGAEIDDLNKINNNTTNNYNDDNIKDLYKIFPKYGEVEFKDVVMRYRKNLDPALKGLTFKVLSGESCGIVGRTGAGKSSIMVGLFRLVDLTNGCILVDGIDISKIPKSMLRSCLTLVSQDPVVFHNTIRFNLDPFDLYNDNELWFALEQVNLKKTVENKPKKLETIVSSTENLSTGEKQLLCLARALLRKSKIVLLDEASSNIDSETEKVVQLAIDEVSANNTTMLTIAHRLNTMIKHDKVLVMENGKAIEHDIPALLLRDNKTIFHKLVEDTGVKSAEKLKQLAEEQYKIILNKNNKKDKIVNEN